MKTRVISQRALLIIFIISLVVLGALTLIPRHSAGMLVEAGKWETHTQEVLSRLGLLEAKIAEAQSSSRGFVFTSNEQFASEFYNTLEAIEENRKKLRVLTSDNPSQQQRLGALDSIINEKLISMKEAVDSKRAGNSFNADRVVDEKDRLLRNDILSRLEELRQEERNLLAERRNSTRIISERLNALLWAGTLLSFGLLIVVFYLFNRDLRRQKQLERERERFFNISLDLLCFAGFDGYLKKINPTWEKTLGYTLEELRAKPYIEFVHPDDRKKTLEEAQLLFSGQISVSFENRFRCKDGSYRWFRWNSIKDETQGIIYATARDNTERKAAEAEREELIKKLQQALAEVKTLQGLLPICSYCKNIRDDEQTWQRIENYISKNTDAVFSHGICPECYEKIVKPQLEEMKKKKEQ